MKDGDADRGLQMKSARIRMSGYYEDLDNYVWVDHELVVFEGAHPLSNRDLNLLDRADKCAVPNISGYGNEVLSSCQSRPSSDGSIYTILVRYDKILSRLVIIAPLNLSNEVIFQTIDNILAEIDNRVRHSVIYIDQARQ
jgi:hypothetical protein